MKWFRADKVGKNRTDDVYGDMIRFAVDRFREGDFAQAIRGFRNAAKLRPLDEHHEALMKRAMIRWKQSCVREIPADAMA